MCVCDRERQRETERDREVRRKRERERERQCLCMSVCARERKRESKREGCWSMARYWPASTFMLLATRHDSALHPQRERGCEREGVCVSEREKKRV